MQLRVAELTDLKKAALVLEHDLLNHQHLVGISVEVGHRETKALFVWRVFQWGQRSHWDVRKNCLELLVLQFLARKSWLDEVVRDLMSI